MGRRARKRKRAAHRARKKAKALRRRLRVLLERGSQIPDAAPAIHGFGLRIRSGEGAICPFCRSELDSAPVPCPDCGTLYHEECAVVFLRCALRGCDGPLCDPAETIVLPRLPVFAQRMNRWEIGRDPDGEAQAVISMPVDWAERKSDAAAAAVGEVMGQTAMDGRLRLSVRYPELVVQALTRERAQELAGRLDEAGLNSLVVPMAELLRPLSDFEAEEWNETATAWTFTDASGKRRCFQKSRPHLVITARIYTVHKVTRRKRSSKHAGFESSTGFAMHRKSHFRRWVAFTYFSGELEPVVIVGNPTKRQRFEQIAESLCAQAHVEAIKVDRSESLMTRIHSGVSAYYDTRFENRPSLVLIARIRAAAWRKSIGDVITQGSQQGSGKETGKDSEKASRERKCD